MIDIHTHILPYADDGADTTDDALDMLHHAKSDGVTGIILTPHTHFEDYLNTTQVISRLVESFMKETENRRPDIPLYIGSEAYFTSSFREQFYMGEIPTLCGSRYVLTEFSFRRPPEDILPVFEQLSKDGYVPIIAHPERYPYWRDAIAPDLRYLLRLGVRLQITAGSLLGQFGDRAQRIARSLLDAGNVSFVASDCHDPFDRSPRLSGANEFIAQSYGAQAVQTLFYTNPQKIINNEPF